MENILEGAVPELEAVKEAIADSAVKEQEYKDTERSLKAKQKELEIQRKRVEEKINSAIKKARLDMEKGYDEQINTAEKAIKEAELKKKNAKAQAVSLRMQRENSSLVDENKLLNAEIKEKFKEAQIPFFCNSPFYYSLFYPHTKWDILVCAITIFICAGIIPFIITRFVNSPVVQVLVWILIVAAFAALYFLIYALTRKGDKNEVIRNMRSSVDRIDNNKKFIKKRNKNIKADPDESQYNLYEYDVQVEDAKNQYNAAQADKEAAVKKFEEVESVEIRQQMQEEKAPVFTELEKEIEQMSNDLTVKTANLQEASAKLEEYSSVLGEKYMRAEKIDELIAVINEGRAATVQEAMDAQKSK